MGQKKICVPTGIKPMNSRRLGGALSTELRDLMESKVILLSSYVTGVLHTVRISTAEVIWSSDKSIKVVNIEFSN